MNGLYQRRMEMLNVASQNFSQVTQYVHRVAQCCSDACGDSMFPHQTEARVLGIEKRII